LGLGGRNRGEGTRNSHFLTHLRPARSAKGPREKKGEKEGRKMGMGSIWLSGRDSLRRTRGEEGPSWSRLEKWGSGIGVQKGHSSDHGMDYFPVGRGHIEVHALTVGKDVSVGLLRPIAKTK